MKSFTKAAADAASKISDVVSRSGSKAPFDNPPPSAPGYDDELGRLEADKRAFYDALHEVRITESSIEKEQKPGGCLHYYTLTPDEAHYINGDTWLGGLHDRTVSCTNGNIVSGMSFADLEKAGCCACGCCKLRMAPFCGLWRCCLYRRYKIGIKHNGQVQIANNFPEKKEYEECWSHLCACFTWITLGDFESTKRYDEKLCSSSATNDGKRIVKMEEAIAHHRDVIKASELGKLRRGEIPPADAITETMREQDPFWRHWKKDTDVTATPIPNDPPVAAAADVPNSLPSAAFVPNNSPTYPPVSDITNDPPSVYIDPKNPPVAVAVPMER
uniref:Uncharacterized protein n=1 Tax=Helicotheca tamesis TaxID=374047 RepID=A0A7S2I378_9STRA